jgi:hypothetical protein
MTQSIIILKNSGNTGASPNSSDLDYGEVAINYADGKLFYKDSSDVVQSFTSDPGTVKSVDVSGGNTGLITTGGPITDIGTITLGGTLAITAGGTGANTATDAINALLPVQANNVGKLLSTNGTTIAWVIVQYSDIAGTPDLANVALTGMLGDLENVNFAVQPVNNQVLTYNALTGKWIAANTQQVQYLNQIGDVYAPFPIAEGTVLVYDSSNSRWQSTTVLDQQTMDGGTY